MRPSPRAILGCAAVLGVAAILRWPIAAMPLVRDEGEYAYMARRWLAGEVPYRAAFDQKPPGVFAAYAVILAVFGTSPSAIHWGTQAYTLGTLGMIYLVGRRLYGPTAGLAAALLAAYMTADRCVGGSAANTELFMILPLTAGFLAALRAAERSGFAWAAAAGACGMLAMLFKQVALPNVGLSAVVLLTAPRQRARLVFTYSAAALGVLAAVVGYFAAGGALREFLDCVVVHNLAYAQQVPLYYYPVFFIDSVSFIVFQWWPVILLAVEAYRRPVFGSPGNRLAVLWLAASLLGVAVGGYFRDHYYVQMIPSLAVLAGRGAAVVAGHWSPNRPVLSAAVAGGCIVYGVLVMPKYYLVGSPTEKCRFLYRDAPFPESVPVGQYLQRHAAPDETIFVYGSEPQIYFYADRRTACRYIYVYPLLTPAPGVLERQQAALDEVTSARPRFIVVHRDVLPFYFGDQRPPLHFRDELIKLLARDYRLVGVAGPEDTVVRQFQGAVPSEATLKPPVEHTLAVWRRRES
jgi:hypothetical protein